MGLLGSSHRYRRHFTNVGAGSERARNVPKVTQMISGEVRAVSTGEVGVLSDLALNHKTHSLLSV